MLNTAHRRYGEMPEDAKELDESEFLAYVRRNDTTNYPAGIW